MMKTRQFCCWGLFHWLGLEPGVGLFRRHLWCKLPVTGRNLLEAGCLHSSEWSCVGYIPPAPGSTGEAVPTMLAAAGVPWIPAGGQSWDLGIMSCWGGFRNVALNFLTFFSFKNCTSTFQPQKYFKDICDVWESLGSDVMFPKLFNLFCQPGKWNDFSPLEM